MSLLTTPTTDKMVKPHNLIHSDLQSFNLKELAIQSHSNDWHYPNQPYLIEDEPAEPDAELDVMLADPELAEPPMYAVVMYNDDYTPMEFVVYILQSQFRHSVDSAVEVMLSIHHKGRGIAGIYPKDIAETKAKTVNIEAKKEGYPLLTQIEPHQG